MYWDNHVNNKGKHIIETHLWDENGKEDRTPKASI